MTDEALVGGGGVRLLNWQTQGFHFHLVSQGSHPSQMELDLVAPAILWMVVKSVSHHFETMGSHCLLVFSGNQTIPGLLNGCDRISSTAVADS